MSRREIDTDAELDALYDALDDWAEDFPKPVRSDEEEWSWGRR